MYILTKVKGKTTSIADSRIYKTKEEAIDSAKWDSFRTGERITVKALKDSVSGYEEKPIEYSMYTDVKCELNVRTCPIATIEVIVNINEIAKPLAFNDYNNKCIDIFRKAVSLCTLDGEDMFEELAVLLNTTELRTSKGHLWYKNTAKRYYKRFISQT